MSERGSDPLLRLAEAVADGEAVDWMEASRSGGAPPERLERLRILAAIGRVCGMARDIPPPPGEPLFRWRHLEVLARIGEGVYGEVYRARDTALDREVAVKFLRPGATPAAVHALQEGRHLARIRHPGVVTVYGAEESDGRIGIWMEHVQGPTLEDLLQSAGPIPVREAARLGIDICRALDAVHRAGLVHRDLKTRNVVLDGSGRVVLVDLGAGVDARGGGAEDLAGTPIYLAPEVLRGEPASPRSDVYGVGVILYRLVTGAYPVVAADLATLREAHARGVTQPLRTARADLPGAFVRAVERALSTDPARRFATAGGLEQALVAALGAHRRRPARVALLLAVVAAAAAVSFLVWRSQGPDPAPAGGRPWVAVADVVHELGDRDLDAVARLLVISLEQSPALSVLTRARMSDLLGRSHRPEPRMGRTQALEIGRRANATAVLIPTIVRAGAGYRARIEAVDPRRGRTLFRASADATDRDALLSVVDTLAHRVRLALEPGADAAQAGGTPVAGITTASLGAFGHYDRAERHIDRLAMPMARAHLDSALALDPSFALAHSRRAYVCWWMNDGACEREHLARAFALIDRIPARQRFHLRAQGAMADRQGLEAARAILLEMERFYPDDKEMLYDIGDYSSHLNEFPAAIQYLERVVRMDGTFVRALQHLARVHRDLGRAGPYLEWARRYAAAESTSESQVLLGNALIAAGERTAGTEVLRRGRARAPGHSLDFSLGLAAAAFHAGRPREGTMEYERELPAAPTPSARAFLLRARAGGLVHQGAYRRALRDLDRASAVARRAGDAIEEALARVDAALLHRVGLDDPRSARAQLAPCAALEPAITYEAAYFHYWPYWGGRFKLHLLDGEVAAAESRARRAFPADKWFSPYVTAYLHAARGECAQAEAAAERVLEWGPAAENIPLLYFLSRCRFEAGRPVEATRSLERLQGLQSHLTLGTPYYAKSLLLSGMSHERNGDTVRAARSYSTLVDLWRESEPGIEDLAAARRRLAALPAVPASARR